MPILATILSLFVLIGLGFAAIRTGYVGADRMPALSDLVVKIALPALIFDAVTGVPPGQAIDWTFVAGYALASLAVFVLGFAVAVRIMGMTPGRAGLIGLGISNSNSGFMGYPVAMTVIGDAAAPMLAQCMIVENTLMIPLALALMEIDGSHPTGGRWRRVLAPMARAARNPIIVALGAALAVSILGVPVPRPIARSVALLADVAPPVALFVLGGTLAALPVARLYGPVSLLVAGKLVLHPLAVFLALTVLPGVDTVTLAGGILFAAVPMLSIYPILGQRVGLPLMTATALLTATLVSFATITAITSILTRHAGAM